MIWARASAAGRYELHLQSTVDSDESLRSVSDEASADDDLTLSFQVDGLTAATAYDWWITCNGAVVHGRGQAPLITAMSDEAGAATIAFGSCADERRYPDQTIWGQLLARSPQALVLLGDTPYIDDRRRDVRRRRYREFYAAPAVRAALCALPTYATWDDHDYATNDQFGATSNADQARAVFCEYHAQPFGDGQSGIYLRFRRGPIEVFLLDTRTFANRTESPLAAGEQSLLGPQQLAWLQEGLRASTAKFKVLASGMVWNGAVRSGKPDCWGRWLAERNGLLNWLREDRIDGVVLVSGDVHRARLIMHPVADLVGYDLPELISSPLAQNPLESNNVDVPGLVFDAGEHECALLLRAARTPLGARLTARFVTGDGREILVRDFAHSSLRCPQ